MGNIYIGNNSEKASEIKNAYVGVNGIARQVKAVYVGDSNNKARLVWNSNPLGTLCYLGVRNGQLRVVVSNGYESDTKTYSIPYAITNWQPSGSNYGIKKIFDTYYISCKRIHPDRGVEDYVRYKTKDFINYEVDQWQTDVLHSYHLVKQAGNNVIYYTTGSSLYVSTDKGETFTYNNKISISYHFCTDANDKYVYYRSSGDYAYMYSADLTTNQINTHGSFTEAYDGSVRKECAGNGMALFFTSYGNVYKMTPNGGRSMNRMTGDTFNSTNYVESCEYFNGLFYIITNTNKLYTSADGINWTFKMDLSQTNTIGLRNFSIVNDTLHIFIGTTAISYKTSEDDKTYVYCTKDGNTFESYVVNELITSAASV